MIQHETSRRSRTVVLPGCRCGVNVVLRKFGTQNICQLKRISMSASTYASKYGCIIALVMFFRDRMIAVIFINKDPFSLIVFKLSRKKTETRIVNMTTPNIVTVIMLFHCLLVFHDWIQEKNLMKYRRGE